MKEATKVNRRQFITRLGVLGVTGLGAGAVLSACGGSSDNGSAAGGAEGACSDVSGLTDAEVQTRTVQNYVEVTPKPDQRCDNCQFWIKPEAGKTCGGCQVVKGPINPGGWCMSWVQPQA